MFQILIDTFEITHLIFTGVAGGLLEELNVGDIVVSTSAMQHDIDGEAGVSMATVSRVVNGNPNVKPTTRKKVLEAIEQLGYAPGMLTFSPLTSRG